MRIEANRLIGWMCAVFIACTVNVARAEPTWSWSFSQDTVAMPYEGFLFGWFSNDPTSTEDLFLGETSVAELPDNGNIFVPALGTRIVFTAVPSSAVLHPGQSATLPVYSIVMVNPAATPIADGSYTVQPAYYGRFGPGRFPTSRLADQPVTLTVSVVPEPSTFASLLLGLPLLLACLRFRMPSARKARGVYC